MKCMFCNIVKLASICFLTAIAGCNDDKGDNESSVISSQLEGEWIGICDSLNVDTFTQATISVRGSDIVFTRNIFVDPACQLRILEQVESGIFSEGGSIVLDSDGPGNISGSATVIDITVESVAVSIFVPNLVEMENQDSTFCSGFTNWQVGVSIDITDCDNAQGIIPFEIYTIYNTQILSDDEIAFSNFDGELLLLAEVSELQSTPENRPNSLGDDNSVYTKISD